MRRLLCCLSTLLLTGIILLVLVARGPGLRTLPIPGNFESLVSPLALNAGARGPDMQKATPARLLPTAEPSTVSPLPSATVPQPGNVTLSVAAVGPAGRPLDTVIDGNAIGLTARVSNSTPATVAGPVYFSLKPLGAGGVTLAQCDVEVAAGGEATCTASVAADGWAWQDHARVARRTVYASLIGYDASTTLEIAVAPKPVVLVHGFTSNAATWSVWTGPAGFLAQWGVPGYAVGDEQFGIEAMNTGDFDHPRRPTKSIAENAEIVARYVDAVRQATGAERVDLVAHSMGGLISRYYVSQLMPLVERSGLPTVPAVNQLYMIGTPNAGTPCAIPPATLGLYPPATTQLTPAYVQRLFNPQTSDSRGVSFFILAGDPVQDYAALVCTTVPTDVFVSVASAAGAIPITADVMPVRHSEQTKSPAVFDRVLQSLSRDPTGYPIPLPTAPAVVPAESDALQVSVIDSGTLTGAGSTAAGKTVSVTVDDATAVSFQLYAPGQDVEMTVVDAAGRRITQGSAKETAGAAAATDEGRGTMATQGFKFENPKAGRWQLLLTPRKGAESDGGVYAVAAFLQSDLRLRVDTPSARVPAGKLIPIRAALTGPVASKTAQATAAIRDVHGEVVADVTLFDDGAHDDGAAGDGVFGGPWRPENAGLYTVAVTATGQSEAGNAFQRVGMLAVEVEE